jgi:hypothetical protein
MICAATDAKPRKRHDFRHLKDGLYAAKQRPGFQNLCNLWQNAAEKNEAAVSDWRLQLFVFIRVDSWLKCAHQIDEPEDLLQ